MARPEHLAQLGFFSWFEKDDGTRWHELYGPIDDANAIVHPPELNRPAVTQAQSSAEAALPETQWKLLASAIPSMSYAAAANAIGIINQGATKRNFDMNNDNEFKSKDWPSAVRLGREAQKPEHRADWYHSDFWMVAPTYTHRMYLKMVELGKLDE